jgi:hypothetical protein
MSCVRAPFYDLRAMLLFCLGIAVMGLLTGILSGISASPVVSVVIPLVFALISAGGGFYIIWGKRDGDENISKKNRSVRARFMGIQMLAFAPCFMIGLWAGVYAKFNSDRLWPQHSKQPAYVRFASSDPALLHYLRSLDSTLASDGVSISDRTRILQALYDTHDKWKDHVGELAQQLNSKQTGPTRAANTTPDQSNPFRNERPLLPVAEGPPDSP